ncbi:MAG: GspE/PulE family protein [Treponema sp.]|nr:GspE/PulE family protein [Treponema sp.]
MTVSLKDFVFSSSCGEQYGESFMVRRGAVKYAETDDKVTVVLAEGSGKEVCRFLEGFHLPKKTEFISVPLPEFASFVGSRQGNKTDGTETVQGFALEAIDESAPVVNIINALCIDAIRTGASDIHAEAQEDSVHIRYRVDGVLHPVKEIALPLFRQLSNRIKVMARLNTMEQRLPQDGRMTVSVAGETLDLRVSIVPTSEGESIVLRLFRGRGKAYELDELGFSGGQLAALRSAVTMPYGLVILSGPTGSGKTTTLHALLKTLPYNERKIITIEDPVEQKLAGINQIQVNEAINLGFGGMLRRVLRQDPDVIMVGEIRDEETAELALRAALTGHLILSTVHTNDSVTVINRLIDMGLERYLIASSLRCACAQRLVRKLCACARAAKPGKREKALFAKYGIAVSNYREKTGCEACGGTGYRGRTVIGEVFGVGGELSALIEKGAAESEIRRALNMKSLAYSGLEKCAAGVTGFSELEAEALL